MKLLFDLLPVILFFVTFKVADANAVQAATFANAHLSALVSGGQVLTREAPVLLATAVVILATTAQVLWLRLRGRRIEPSLWVSLALVVVLGGATLWFHDETFIKWKPSVMYWVLGTVLWVSAVVLRRNLLRTLLGSQVVLPDAVWQRLNAAWVGFFGLMGLLNLWVAYTFPTDVWVSFKLFGGLGLTLAFTLLQALYIGRHQRPADAADLPDSSA